MTWKTVWRKFLSRRGVAGREQCSRPALQNKTKDPKNLTKGTNGDLLRTVTDYEGCFRKPRMVVFDYVDTLV